MASNEQIKKRSLAEKVHMMSIGFMIPIACSVVVAYFIDFDMTKQLMPQIEQLFKRHGLEVPMPLKLGSSGPVDYCEVGGKEFGMDFYKMKRDYE